MFQALLTLTESDLRQPPLQITTLGDVKRLGIAIRKIQLENRCVVEQLCITQPHSPTQRYTQKILCYPLVSVKRSNFSTLNTKYLCTT